MVYFTTFVRPSLTRGIRGLVDLGLSRPKRSVDKHNRSKNIPWDFLYTVSDTFISHLMQTIACIIQEQFSMLHHITCLQISVQASLSVFLNK